MLRHLLLTLLLIHTLSPAATTYCNIKVREIRSIYSADTFKGSMPEWPALVGKSISIRMLGIDAPEMRGECQTEKDAARAAKQYTVDKLRSSEAVELRGMQRGKYFRVLADA